MAILIISNHLLKDPEIWNMVSDFCKTMEIVKVDNVGTVMRITNDELPQQDYLVDLVCQQIAGIRPFITSFNVYQMYQP